MVTLGRIEAVEPTSVWAHEAHDFTPWLLHDPTALESVLDIGIEFQASEHPIGGFRLDLFGRDLTHDAVLIVENQLTQSDHTHLGQLVTYASGADAATIVWVAKAFREEHRQAIDWLNARTSEDTRFFAVKITVVRIGDSLPAPAFELIASPNDWQKQARSATAPSRRATTAGPVAVQGDPWTSADAGLAAEIWQKLTPNAHLLIGALLDRPGERLTSNELADVLGVDGPYQVAGSLSWPGIYCRRAGKALFFQFEGGTSDGPATYWVTPEVAAVFNPARGGIAPPT